MSSQPANFTHQEVIDILKSQQSAHYQERYSSFFKSEKGSYSEHDEFLGVETFIVRKIAKKYASLPFQEVDYLMKSKWHEMRFCGLCILIEKYCKANRKKDEEVMQAVFLYYVDNLDFVNNWDLVDISAPYISGEYLLVRDRSILYEWAASGFLWRQRVAMLSTLAFIRKNDFEDTLRLAEIYLNHSHDLIHKATGWMLREVGKRDESILTEFLNRFASVMPRTMLRYSLEKYSPETRKYFMELKK